MKGAVVGSLLLALTLAACDGRRDGCNLGSHCSTTNSAIAIANLEHLIEQQSNEPGVEELLLLRSRMLADYVGLDRVVALTEHRARDAEDLLRRSRSRSAAHRFSEALADVEAARLAGAQADQVDAQRASILVAMGRAKDVVAQLESNVVRRPGFATHAALAGAYASLGRLAEADELYAAALHELDTTSPFPYAWIYFMRGVMWSEQAGDTQRGEAMYVQALRYVPEFVAANIHLAELEAARHDKKQAIDRLERVTAVHREPEALALLGRLHMDTGEPERGRRELDDAQRGYEALLRKHPLAFADHAAEFYLSDGDDAEKAWLLAQMNLGARQSRRAYVLAIKAAEATRREIDAKTLRTRMHEMFGPRAA